MIIKSKDLISDKYSGPFELPNISCLSFAFIIQGTLATIESRRLNLRPKVDVGGFFSTSWGSVFVILFPNLITRTWKI